MSSKWFAHSHASVKTNFCQICSTILTIPPNGPITCDYCGNVCQAEDLESRVIVTRSKKKEQSLISYQKDNDDFAAKMSDGSVLCGKCGHHELYFKTAQLRSADEGQTIFYECAKCGFTWSVNS